VATESPSDAVLTALATPSIAPLIPFYKFPKVKGKLVTFAGLTGTGKSFAANFWSGSPETTYFIDTEPVHTTIETLEGMGQEKVWKAFCWDDIKKLTSEFLRIRKDQQSTLVIDSGSVLVQWIKDKLSHEKGDKAITPWEHEDVWDEIRGLLKDVIYKNGHNLVITLLLRPNYSPEKRDTEGKLQKYGQRDGTYSPYEWKDLAFHCHYAFQLERGVYLPKSSKVLFPDKIFCRVRKTRFANEGFKKFLVPFCYPIDGKELFCYTEEAADTQLRSRFTGTFFDILRELKPSCTPSVQKDLTDFIARAPKEDTEVEGTKD
jgi:hypothetical protein